MKKKFRITNFAPENHINHKTGMPVLLNKTRYQLREPYIVFLKLGEFPARHGQFAPRAEQ
jgi:hypothetical protein